MYATPQYKQRPECNMAAAMKNNMRSNMTNINVHRPPTLGTAPAFERFEPPSSYHPAEGPSVTFLRNAPDPKAYATLHLTPAGTVIVRQLAAGGDVIPANAFFEWEPVNVVCPYCQSCVTTVTTPINGSMTWIACFILTLFGCVFGCCLIPFFINTLKDVQHSCPNCQYPIATYNRLTGGQEPIISFQKA